LKCPLYFIYFIILSCSDETKEKIRKTITRQWRERLKLKKARERFISSWAESIANAAKKGGHGERELDWDSYEKIEKEIALQHLQRSADVAKAKEMAQMRAERRAKAKAEKAKLTLQKRMAKVKGLAKKKPTKKSKEEKDELAAAEDLKLKERLTKVRNEFNFNFMYIFIKLLLWGNCGSRSAYTHQLIPGGPQSS